MFEVFGEGRCPICGGVAKNIKGSLRFILESLEFQKPNPTSWRRWKRETESWSLIKFDCLRLFN